MEKNCYERCVYQWVHDKNLSWDISQKSMEKRIHTTKNNEIHSCAIDIY